MVWKSSKWATIRARHIPGLYVPVPKEKYAVMTHVEARITIVQLGLVHAFLAQECSFTRRLAIQC